MKMDWNLKQATLSKHIGARTEGRMMQQLWRLLFSLAVLVVFGTSAWAQDGEVPLERTIDFGDEMIEGELVRPDGDLIEGQRHESSTSLIEIREHFIDKMIQSAEDI